MNRVYLSGLNQAVTSTAAIKLHMCMGCSAENFIMLLKESIAIKFDSTEQQALPFSNTQLVSLCYFPTSSSVQGNLGHIRPPEAKDECPLH